MTDSQFKLTLEKAQKLPPSEALPYIEQVTSIAHELPIEDFKSLVNVLETNDQATTIEPLKSMYQYQIKSVHGKYLCGQQKFNEALKYFEDSKNLAEQIENKQLLALANNNIGFVFHHKENYVECFTHYTTALNIIRSIEKNDKKLVKSLLNLSVLYKQQGFYERAVESLLEVLQLTDQQEEPLKIAACYNTLANIYKKMQDYDGSLDYHLKALEVRELIGNRIEITKSINNIGMVYLEKKEYERALQYFTKAYVVKKELKDDKLLATTLSNMGMVFQFLGNLEKAQQFFKDSLTLRRNSLHKGELATILIDLGALSIKQNQFKEANKYLEEAHSLVVEIDNNELMVYILENYTKIQELLGNYKLALAYHRKYHKLKAKIFSEKRTRQITEIQMRYETEKKEQEIAFLRKQNDIKTDLMRELHHRVKNNLYVLANLLSLQSNQLKDSDARNIVKEGENRVRAMNLIHHELYNEDDVHVVDMEQYIKNLTTHLMEAYGYRRGMISINFDITYIKLEVDKAIYIGLIINEIISNAFKHAFKGKKQPTLRIKFYEPILNELCLHIADNGNGIPDSVEIDKTTSFGLRLIDKLSRQLEGKLTLDRKKGTTWKLHLPV